MILVEKISPVAFRGQRSSDNAEEYSYSRQDEEHRLLCHKPKTNLRQQ